MGWGELHGTGTGDFPFRARWKLPPGSAKKTETAPGFATKEAAKVYADAREEEWRVDLRRGDYHDPARGEITVDDYFHKKWLPAQRLSDKSRANRLGEYRNHIGKRWGSRALNSLDLFEIMAFDNQLRDDLSQSSAGNVMELLRLMLEDAVFAGLIKTVPMRPRRRRGTREPSNQRPGMVTTLEQIAGIRARLRDSDALLVLVIAFTGMRWGEACGLRRSFLTLHAARDGRPAHGFYVIDDAIGTVHEDPHDGRRYFGPPKGGSKGRTVHLPPFLVAALLAYLKKLPAEEDLLFSNSNGNAHSRSDFNGRWRKACDGWPERRTSWGHRGVAAAPAIHEGLVPHDLRHTFKTWLAEDGFEPRYRDEWLGHKSPGMDGIYVHMTPAVRERILASLQRRWEIHTGKAAPNVLPFRASGAA